MDNKSLLVDIGSLGGLPPEWNFKDSNFVTYLCDPQEQINDSYEFKYLEGCAFSYDGEVEFYVTNKVELSSIFKPNYQFIKRFPRAERFQIISSKKVKSFRLDSVKELHNGALLGIKIDSQGSEFEILQGAKKLVSNSLPFLFLEVHYEEVYLNIKLQSTIDQYLREFGYELHFLKTHVWNLNDKNIGIKTNGALICWADAIYLPKIEALSSISPSKLHIVDRLKIAKNYGLTDYAQLLIDMKSLND